MDTIAFESNMTQKFKMFAIKIQHGFRSMFSESVLVFSVNEHRKIAKHFVNINMADKLMHNLLRRSFIQNFFLALHTFFAILSLYNVHACMYISNT